MVLSRATHRLLMEGTTVGKTPHTIGIFPQAKSGLLHDWPLSDSYREPAISMLGKLTINLYSLLPE